MKPNLFLLHFSGGNKYSFNFLKGHLEDTFEFHPLEIAGRGMRMGEAFNPTLDAAAEDLFQQIQPLLNSRPFVIYGHSLGASLGLLLTHRLEAIGKAPLRLVVSGNAGPGPEAEKRHAAYSKMSRSEFIAALQKMGGLSDDILANQELMDFMLPILRADFKMFSTQKTIFHPVETAIHAIMGDAEELVEHIGNWQKYTRGEYEATILPGHHFFIHDQAEKLAALLKDTCLIS